MDGSLGRWLASSRTEWRRRLAVLGVALAIVCGLSVVEVAQVLFSPGVPNANRADRPLLLMFWGSISFWLAGGLLLPVIRQLSQHYALGGRRWWVSVLIHAAASLCFSFVYLVAGYLLRAVFYYDKAFSVQIPYLINYYYVYGVFFYWAALGCFLAANYYSQARASSLAASRLETALTQAQLQILRNRLNPHFLFNAMGAISGLALTGQQEQVVEMLGRLSQLLRRSIDDLSDTQVRLSTELGFLHDYIAIQSVRFPQRLTFDLAVSPETLNALVPAMLLQPLVENAVEHGIAATTGAGSVSLTTRREGDWLHMEIRDTGPGFHSSNRTPRVGTGVGLESTRQRLQYLYASNHRLECLDLPQRGACVVVSIPFREESPQVESI